MTPRRFAIDTKARKIIVIETEHNAYNEQMKEKRKQQVAEEMVSIACCHTMISVII